MYLESPRRLPYLRELLALVAVVLTAINVFAPTPRVRIRTYIQSPTSHDAANINVWTGPNELRRAAMTPEESVHYKLETDAGGAEWASVLPHGRGVVFLNSTTTTTTTSPSDPSEASARSGDGNGDGKTPYPYRVAMFHQLDCLDVLRGEMVLLQHTHTSKSPNPLTTSSSSTSSTPNRAERAEFCLNYLRESILCHADSHLERVRSEFGLESGEKGRGMGRAVVLGTERTDCVDWEGVWRAVEENWGEVMREEEEGRVG